MEKPKGKMGRSEELKRQRGILKGHIKAERTRELDNLKSRRKMIDNAATLRYMDFRQKGKNCTRKELGSLKTLLKEDIAINEKIVHHYFRLLKQGGFSFSEKQRAFLKKEKTAANRLCGWKRKWLEEVEAVIREKAEQ